MAGIPVTWLIGSRYTRISLSHPAVKHMDIQAAPERMVFRDVCGHAVDLIGYADMDLDINIVGGRVSKSIRVYVFDNEIELTLGDDMKGMCGMFGMQYGLQKMVQFGKDQIPVTCDPETRPLGLSKLKRRPKPKPSVMKWHSMFMSEY